MLTPSSLRGWIFSCAGALALAACESEPPMESGAWPPPTAINRLAAPATLNLHLVTSDIPDTAAGAVLGWVLESFNVRPEQLTAEQVTAKFAPSVFEATAAADLVANLQEMANNRPYSFVGFNAPPRSNRVVAVVGSVADGYRQLTIMTDESGRATSLLFEPLGPATDEAPPEPTPPAPAGGSGEGSAAPADGSAPPADGSAAPATP